MLFSSVPLDPSLSKCRLGTKEPRIASHDNTSFQKNSVILQKNNKCSRDSSFVLQKVQDGESTSLNGNI